MKVLEPAASMSDFLTPKQAARALGTSESSIKRLCDAGSLAGWRTAGGHRRLSVGEVVRFARDQGWDLARPEILGLPATLSLPPLELLGGVLADTLLTGSKDACHRLLISAYMARYSIPQLADQAIAPALATIGRAWECGDIEIYHERRACEWLTHTMEILSALVPAPLNGPRAFGAAPSRDQYTLPTRLVELALRERGWQAESLGVNLPFDTLARALVVLRPRLFWLSVSHVEKSETFLTGYQHLHDTALLARIPIVVGGNALTLGLRQQMRFAAHCDTLRHLEDFLATLPALTSETTS